MAYIVNTTQTDAVVAASYTVSLGAHQTGDLLLVFLAQDGGATAISTASSGWSVLIQERAGSASRHAVAYCIASSGAEAAPVFSGSNDDWLGCCVVVRDAHATPFGSLVDGTDFASDTFSTGGSHSTPALTSATDGCLLFYSTGVDGPGATFQVRNALSEVRCVAKQTDAANVNILQTVGYVQQQGAGAAPTATIYKASLNRPGTAIVLAVRNKAGGALQSDIRPSITELYCYGNFGSVSDPAITWEAADQFAASINGITCTSTAPTVTAGNSGNQGANWGTHTALRSAAAGGSGLWVGGTHAIASTDMSGKVFGLQFYRSFPTTDNFAGAEGLLVAFSDGTNWAAYRPQSKSNGWVTSTPNACFIAPGVAEAYASSGTVNWSAITRIGYFWHRIGAAATNADIGVKNAVLFGTTAITGGGESRPATFADYAAAMQSWGGWEWADLQGGVQTLAKSSVQIGDSTNATYFDAGAESLAFPRAYGTAASDQMKWNVGENAVSVAIKAGANDTINLAACGVVTQVNQAMNIDAASSGSADYSFAGASIVGYTPTWSTNVPAASATFTECGKIDAKGSDWTDCTIKRTTSTDAAIAFTADGGSMTRCTIDVSSTDANYHLELGADVTEIALADVTFTGTPAVDKIRVQATTGTVTIVTSGSTALLDTDITSEGATVILDAPSVSRGLAFTGLVAGSTVKVFDTGTTDELFADTNSGTSETWSEDVPGSLTVDYTIQKDGYLPIRVTGVTVTGAVSGGVLVTPIQQSVDRAYAASSGLAFGSTATVNTGDKVFSVTTATTVQNWYCFMVESWRTEATLQNVAFPLSANGPNSFQLAGDWTFDEDSLAFLSRDGVRYLNSAGDITDAWAALLAVGVPSGMTVRYQQTDGGTTQSAANTGNIDQLVKIVEAGNFDYSGHLVLKVQGDGYDQAEFDAIATYGTLEDQLYVVSLVPTANGIAAQGGITGITLTDHGASPVTWNSKQFSLTITDDTGHSGEEILQWVRDQNAFDYHDLVQTNGAKFKTVRGRVYGDTGATLKGVRVLTSEGEPHPDFDLFTADDGTTYSPPVIAQALATILADSRVQLYNVTQAAEVENVFITGTSYSKTVTTEADTGDVLRLTVHKKGRQTAIATAVWAASGITFLIDQPEDAIYTTWGIDGEAVSEFSLDVTGTIEIDANDADGSTTKTRLGAWYSYILTTENGIRHAVGAITALAANAIRINVDVLDMAIENTNATTALRFTDNDVRLYRSDGSSIIAVTSYSIHNDYSGVPDVAIVNVEGSSVITGDIADIASYVPTAAATASAVWATDEAARVADLAKIHGLVADTPLVVTPTSRTAGSISQTITQDGDAVTVSRT